jgi:hypothetical protein
VLSYTVAIRSLDGAGTQKRGVRLLPTVAKPDRNGVQTCNFQLTNTGRAGTTSTQPEDVTQYVDGDVYRLTARSNGWPIALPNALATADAGQQVTVPVHTKPGTGPIAQITLTATSESDPTKSSTATCTAIKR